MGDTNSTKKDKVAPVKVNWETAKAKYMKSEHLVLADFGKEELGIQKLSSFHRRKMVGWIEEKKAIIDKAKEGAKSDFEKKMKSAYEVPIEQLNNLKKGIFDVLLARLSQITQKVKMEIDPATGKKTLVVMGDIPTKELVDILKVVKTEMGEPTNINQSQLGDDEKDMFNTLAGGLLKIARVEQKKER